MNAKGTFTALLGAMVLIMVISSTYYNVTAIEAQDSTQILRSAGDMKRVVIKTRFLIDDSIALAMATQAASNCTANQDYSGMVNTIINASVQRAKNLTGVECTVQEDLASVTNNSRFTVTLDCSFEGMTTTSSIELEKRVTAETQPDGSCLVKVTDTDSGVVQASSGSGGEIIPLDGDDVFVPLDGDGFPLETEPFEIPVEPDNVIPAEPLEVFVVPWDDFGTVTVIPWGAPAEPFAPLVIGGP